MLRINPAVAQFLLVDFIPRGALATPIMGIASPIIGIKKVMMLIRPMTRERIAGPVGLCTATG